MRVPGMARLSLQSLTLYISKECIMLNLIIVINVARPSQTMVTLHHTKGHIMRINKKQKHDVAPEKEIRIKGNTEPWIDEESLELIRQRDRALFKSNQNKSDYRLKTKFRELRNKATRVNRKKKAKHFQKKVEENKDNPKKIWDELKTLGYSNKSREKQSIVLEVDNEKIFDDTKVASVINNYYLNVAASLVLKLPIIDKIYDVGSNIFKNYYLGKGVLPNKFKLKCVSESFVLNELKKINPSKVWVLMALKVYFYAMEQKL